MFDKLQLFEERGWLCACGCGKRAEHAHHCLIPNLKRFEKYVNTPLNIALVNGEEHVQQKKFDTDEWLNSLPSKMKHRITFTQKEA